MYEDSWYSLVPDHVQKRNPSTSQPSGHRRRASLLQQPNGNPQPGQPEPLDRLLEEPENVTDPPEPTVLPRAKSYSDFYHVVRAQLSKDATAKRRKRRAKDRSLDALMVVKPEDQHKPRECSPSKSIEAQLLDASQQEYLLYRDQLHMAERHLNRLVDGASSALDLLSSLTDNFLAVEAQTSLFQAQCDDLVSEERRLQKLADEVGTDLHYYAYLDGVTRRLNAPGAGRLVNHEDFGDILTNLDACINFMVEHPEYRDAEPYLARYQSLLTKALHLLEVGFNAHLERSSAEISKQILATQSEAARHALAYGRSEELILEADGLIANVQQVITGCYDQFGEPTAGHNSSTYSNTAVNLISSFLDTRDRSLRPMLQHDLAVFSKETKDINVETACRNFIKQSYERSFSEAGLFSKVFSIDPQISSDSESAYAALKHHQRSLVNIANVAPIATALHPILQTSDLQTTCNLLGWITNEYLLLEYDEEETQYSIHCHDLTARLLTEHLWPIADGFFDAEVTKLISKAPIPPDSLKGGSGASNVALSNTYPIVKRALELLAMYDHAMPKERSQKSSPVVFRMVNEAILALQRAEARLKTNKSANPDPDPNLFMIKNLLILKNGLVSLEIGDVRAQPATMQYFGQIWETLSPQNWMGLFRGILGGTLGSTLSLGLWSSVATNTGAGAGAAIRGGAKAAAADQDANEKLDELLRQSIYAFTQRWGTLLNGAGRSGRRGGEQTTEKGLDEKLTIAFGNQPEVVAKLKEAIYINAQAQKEVKAERGAR
ncbi:Sec34-like family protein [Xylariaceae sp. FL0594]|nr:Sec34-like family protein [Xylariaceae sp. FL0594]